MLKVIAGLLGFIDRDTEQDGRAVCGASSQILSQLPEDDDINSNGFTQFFSIQMDTMESCGHTPALACPPSTSGHNAVVARPPSECQSGASSQEKINYRDVQLRVHVRLLKQQEKMKVRLHVKVDPEETQHWVIPEKGKTNDLFFFADTPMIARKRKTSDGYHSEVSATSELLDLGTVPEEVLIPVVREDYKLREFMSELTTEKRGYDCSKIRLGHFVYTKILKKTVSNADGESFNYTFEQTCRVLKDYFIQSRINIANMGDLIFFEKLPRVAKKPDKKKGKKNKEADLLAQLHQSTAYGKEKAKRGSKIKRLSTKEKKQCKEAMEIYSNLEQHYINYRSVYFAAVDEYEVQVIESRYGYFMCEMQEELLVGNMILSGQVEPE